MYRFLIIIEEGQENYSAYAPDLPGCVARLGILVKMLSRICGKRLPCIFRE
jgi:hypothetical protein